MKYIYLIIITFIISACVNNKIEEFANVKNCYAQNVL